MKMIKSRFLVTLCSIKWASLLCWHCYSLVITEWLLLWPKYFTGVQCTRSSFVSPFFVAGMIYLLRVGVRRQGAYKRRPGAQSKLANYLNVVRVEHNRNASNFSRLFFTDALQVACSEMCLRGNQRGLHAVHHRRFTVINCGIAFLYVYLFYRTKWLTRWLEKFLEKSHFCK